MTTPRPDATEAAEYYFRYIDRVADGDVILRIVDRAQCRFGIQRFGVTVNKRVVREHRFVLRIGLRANVPRAAVPAGVAADRLVDPEIQLPA